MLDLTIESKVSEKNGKIYCHLLEFNGDTLEKDNILVFTETFETHDEAEEYAKKYLGDRFIFRRIE